MTIPPLSLAREIVDEKEIPWNGGDTWMGYKLRSPYKNCGFCNGTGYEYVDCGNELSGYDYRSPCSCRLPKKCFEQFVNKKKVRK